MTDVVVSKFNVDMTVQKLFPLFTKDDWLNDECINFWLKMCAELDGALKIMNDSHTPSLWLNSYWFKNLCDESRAYNHGNVKRWTHSKTNKHNVFKKKYFFAPVHTATHWTLIFANIQKKEVYYYDHFYHKGADAHRVAVRRSDKCLTAFLKWLGDEYLVVPQSSANAVFDVSP